MLSNPFFQGLGEVAQQVRVCTALAKGPSSDPSTHIGQLTNACESSSKTPTPRNLTTYSDLQDTCTPAHLHTCTHTPTHAHAHAHMNHIIHTCTHKHTYSCTYETHTYTYVHTSTHTHALMKHIHTHMNTQAHTQIKFKGFFKCLPF